MCLTAPELWPAQARQWYELYDRFFWQQRITAVGYREYPKDVPSAEWSMDVDAGPVVAGHGVAASAFGVGAARKNGRFDRAYPLSAEMLATVGELPNGVLAMPRLLSNVSDAPMLGEAAILWQLSMQPETGFPIKIGGSMPLYVYIVLVSVILLGAWRILEAIWTFQKARRPPEPAVWVPTLQVITWALLLLTAFAALSTGRGLIGVVVLVCAVMLPLERRARTPKGVEDRPEGTPSSAPKVIPADAADP